MTGNGEPTTNPSRPYPRRDTRQVCRAWIPTDRTTTRIRDEAQRTHGNTRGGLEQAAITRLHIRSTRTTIRHSLGETRSPIPTCNVQQDGRRRGRPLRARVRLTGCTTSRDFGESRRSWALFFWWRRLVAVLVLMRTETRPRGPH